MNISARRRGATMRRPEHTLILGKLAHGRWGIPRVGASAWSAPFSEFRATSCTQSVWVLLALLPSRCGAD